MIILSKIINNNQKNVLFASGITVFNNIINVAKTIIRKLFKEPKINIATNNFNFLPYKTLPILIIFSIFGNNAFSQNNNISSKLYLFKLINDINKNIKKTRNE